MVGLSVGMGKFVSWIPGGKEMDDADVEPGKRMTISPAIGAGICCPRCRCIDTRVIKTRPVMGHANNRRRQCAGCAFRFTTREDVIGG